MSKVLRANAYDTGDDAGAYIDFAAQDEVYVSLDVAFSQAMIDGGYFGDFAGIGYLGYPIGSDWNKGLYSVQAWTPSSTLEWAVDFGPSGLNASPALVAETYQLLELHWHKGVLSEAWLDGSSLFSAANGNVDQATRVFVGQVFGGADVYIDNVKVGTSRGGSELFADDFEGGDLSAWTGTFGDATVVDDPFAGGGGVPPPNDDFANAGNLIGPSGSLQGTNAHATNEDPDPLAAALGHGGGASVWYQWLAPSSGFLTLETSDPSSGTPIANTTLGIFTGASLATLVSHGVDDDSGAGSYSKIESVPVVAGTTYYIEVDGYSGDAPGALDPADAAQGGFTLTWTADLTTMHVAARIDGVDYGPGAAVCPDGLAFRTIYLGPDYQPRVAEDIADFRNVKVGSAGYGSSDIWDAAIGSSVVPPFDSTIENDLSGTLELTAAGGVMTSHEPNPTPIGNEYTLAVKDLGADFREIFVQFEFRINSGWTDRHPLAFPDIFHLSGPEGYAPAFPADLIADLHYDSDFVGPDGGWAVGGVPGIAPGLGITPWPPGGGNWQPDTWITIGLHYWISTPSAPEEPLPPFSDPVGISFSFGTGANEAPDWTRVDDPDQPSESY